MRVRPELSGGPFGGALSLRLRVLPFLLVTALAAGLFAAGAAAQTGSGETAPSSVDQKLEELQRELEALRAEMRELREERSGEEPTEPIEEAPEPGAAAPAPAPDGDRLDELERRIDVLASELERIDLGETAVRAAESEHGLGPAASKVYRAADGLSIGGYGEMIYTSPDADRDDGTPSGESDELDFLRAIVYFGYKFDDRFLFNSEIEYEHAVVGEDAEGEVALEFAYLDYLYKPELNLRAGLVLVPMGFLNELHEPTVFLGARRPDVERVILPTTWRENGFGLFGEAGPVSYRTYVVNGFDATGFSAGGIRGGRQEGSETLAEDFAWVGRIDYTPTPGLSLGGSAYVGDSGQGLTDLEGRDLAVGTTVFEGHAEWRWRGLELRGLFARAEVDDVARLNRTLGLAGTESIGEELSGGYVQAGYDVLAPYSSTRQLIPFARYEMYDTQDSVPTGYAADPANDVESLTLGVAFHPIDRIVIKADYQDYDNGAGTAVDRLNVALGYIF